MTALSVTLDWNELAAACAAIVGVLTIIGLAVTFVLVPYLRRELVEPTRETNRQITGTDQPEPEAGPTMRDELATMRAGMGELSGEIEDATLELRAMALMFDGHIEWTSQEFVAIRQERQEVVDEIWAELGRQKAAGQRPGHKHRRDIE